MSLRSKFGILATAGLSLMLCSKAHSQVECWAPGMAAPVILTESNRYAINVPINNGKAPFRYDVYGVAGKIELGNSANNAIVSNGVFKGGLLGLAGTVNSTGYIMLDTGSGMYPEKLTVDGKSPGISVGPLYQYGPNWTLSDPIARKKVTLGFHMAGSTLLGGLLPGLFSPAYYNKNPKGYFYVLGEYHEAPPAMTGTINISSDEVISGASVNVTYGITRFDTPIYRPPFLGLDLGDVGLTVIGTPPQKTVNGPPVASLGNILTGGQGDLHVTVNLGATQGQGWLKISNTP